MNIKYIALGILLAFTTGTCLSQSSGGPYEITQSVIANGGAASGGPTFSITGTAAQSVAGTQSSNGAFGVTGGFWLSFLAPTAAHVSVSGRVTNADGQAIPRVRVMLEGSFGGIRSALTNGFGYFSFDGVEVGHAYIVSGLHKQYAFVPRTVVVNDNVTDLDIIALP